MEYSKDARGRFGGTIGHSRTAQTIATPHEKQIPRKPKCSPPFVSPRTTGADRDLGESLEVASSWFLAGDVTAADAPSPGGFGSAIEVITGYALRLVGRPSAARWTIASTAYRGFC